MRKILVEIPPIGLRVPSFGVFFLLACVAALALTFWRARREKLDPESVFGLAVWLMSGGFIGARVVYLVAHPESVHSLADVFRLWQGGIVFYGCILGGLIGSLIYWYNHPFPFRAMADAVAPALAIGSAVGRVGCFFNGCCFGGVTALPWAVGFPAGSLPWARHVADGRISLLDTHSLPVHPTQLYSAFDGLLILALLSAYFPLRRRDGEVMALLMLTYPVSRFLTEAIRDDEPAVLLGLTISQAISVVVFAGGLVLWAYLASLPKTKFADTGEISPISSRIHRTATGRDTMVPLGRNSPAPQPPAPRREPHRWPVPARSRPTD